MSGIGNYYHGENGEVSEVYYDTDDHRIFFNVLLRGDRHRDLAKDYGSDVGIDPSIRPGDKVTYIRLDNTSGLWVLAGDEHTPLLDKALARCHAHRRRWMEPYARRSDRRTLLESLARETPYQIRTNGTPPSVNTSMDEPHTPLSVFLSYASENVLLARDIYDYLRTEAKLDVWLDLAQQNPEAPSDSEVEAWLRQAVYDMHLFLILVTRTALGSQWVSRELQWASQKAHDEKRLQIIFLNLEDLPLPSRPFGWTLRCRTLAIGEILEETYALIYQYSSRRDWVGEQARRGVKDSYNRPFDYRYAEADAGTALRLTFRWVGSVLHWLLVYQKDGQERHVEGHGSEHIVDIGIKPGDKIASYVFQSMFPLWMRSTDLTITPVKVAREYAKFRASPPA